MPARVHSECFRIPSMHPALRGHFPGNPMVPGVVLLERVAQALERIWGLRLSALSQVKFLCPLRPDCPARLQLELNGAAAQFSIDQAGATVASGTLEAAP